MEDYFGAIITHWVHLRIIISSVLFNIKKGLIRLPVRGVFYFMFVSKEIVVLDLILLNNVVKVAQTLHARAN